MHTPQFNKHVGGPPYSRAKIYAASVSHAANDEHRPPLHGVLLPRVLPWIRQTDGQTDTAPF